MMSRYSAEGYPSEFPVRSKCVALFQRIHGVDTFLFAMYVYEYGHKCPAPNRRRVYISYLDSVQYFEPKCYRTKVYQTMIVEYLRYVKKRGFHTAHIWSCPPTPGDDYIFYCHPKHQLVPREDMLRAWYHTTLRQAQTQGIVIRTTTLYDEYFGEDSADVVPDQTQLPTCLPYFEGDYIPGEIENIIKRSSSSRKGGKDIVMTKIGENLGKMKDNFIVAHLRNRSFAAAVERGEDVSQWREDSDDEMVRRKKAKITGKSSASAPAQLEAKSKDVGAPAVEADFAPLRSETPDDMANDPISSNKSFDTEDLGSVVPEFPDVGSNQHGKQSSSKHNRITSFDDRSLSSIVAKLEASPAPRQEDRQINTDLLDPLPEVNGTSATRCEDKLPISVDTNKRSLDTMTEVVSSYRDKAQSAGVVSDTSDEDATIESEMFESRQQFLNYCQTTHCQFDEMRRAKHSTLMVLFQVHNPGAPKFLQQCGACYNDITHGIRYHCNQCNNFDLCETCYEPIITGLWAKRDPTFSHDKKHTFTAIDMEAALDSRRSLEERQQSLKAHVELVEHAATCPGVPSCKLRNCSRMKDLFKHVASCRIKQKKDCKICKRLWALATMHSRMCSSTGPCEVPFCDRIRERNNRLKRQQQMMDDRRRQAQNELYHAGADS